MKILFISDTHGFHKDLIIPDVDMIIHAGDVANYKDPIRNEAEVLAFIEWFEKVPVEHKLWCAGNHDTSIEKGLVDPYKRCKTTTYLQHQSVNIKGLEIFMSPYTPQFGNWAFNIRRDQLHEYWKDIPDNCDILVTHGPPKGIMDLSEMLPPLEQCGDKALLTRVQEIKPRAHCFGHIHNNGNCINAGTRVLHGLGTTFINASCVTDRQFDKGLTSQGIIMEI